MEGILLLVLSFPLIDECSVVIQRARIFVGIVYSAKCIARGIVCLVHLVWCMGHDAMCHAIVLHWRWGGSALRVVGSVYDQMGLLNRGRCLPLELEVQRVPVGHTDCEYSANTKFLWKRVSRLADVESEGGTACLAAYQRWALHAQPGLNLLWLDVCLGSGSRGIRVWESW